VLSAALAIVGPKRSERIRRATRWMIDAFAAAGLRSAVDAGFDLSKVAVDDAARALLLDADPDPRAQQMLAGFDARGAQSVFVRHLRSLGGQPSAGAVVAAIAATLAWGPLMRKRVSRLTAECVGPWLQLFGTLIGASVEASRHEPGRFCGLPTAELLGRRSLTETTFVALLGRDPTASDLFGFQSLVGMLLTNGPGTISAQGAKGAVSSDGPESPERVQLNKALIGFLSHCGYAHGGNGYEGVAFLIEQFDGSGLQDPGDPKHGIDLGELASKYVQRYAEYKAGRRNEGSLDIQKIPGVNHPVFKDKAVNHDPREVFLRAKMAERGESNVFHDYYRALVQALHDGGVSRTVYCVNIDAVIAALLLKMVWPELKTGRIGAEQLEAAAFTIFVYARMLGCAAEADDHLNRGRNMDTRTPASACRFVT
jgi:hypothetical protein